MCLDSIFESLSKDPNTVKVVIYTGGKVRVFCRQTIHVGIKYVFAWFTTLKFLFL